MTIKVDETLFRELISEYHGTGIFRNGIRAFIEAGNIQYNSLPARNLWFTYTMDKAPVKVLPAIDSATGWAYLIFSNMRNVDPIDMPLYKAVLIQEPVLEFDTELFVVVNESDFDIVTKIDLITMSEDQPIDNPDSEKYKEAMRTLSELFEALKYLYWVHNNQPFKDYNGEASEEYNQQVKAINNWLYKYKQMPNLYSQIKEIFLESKLNDLNDLKDEDKRIRKLTRVLFNAKDTLKEIGEFPINYTQDRANCYSLITEKLMRK